MDDEDVIPGTKVRNKIIRGILGKLQLDCILRSAEFPPNVIKTLEEALVKESNTHKLAFRQFIPSRDRYPKRHLGFHWPWFIQDLGPPPVFDSGSFEKAHQIWVKKPSKATQRIMRRLTEQLSKLARERSIFSEYKVMAESAYSKHSKGEASTGNTHRSTSRRACRLFGKEFSIDQSCWNGDARNMFGDDGLIAQEVRNLEEDGVSDIPSALRQLNCNGTIQCKPSLSMCIAIGTLTLHAAGESPDWVNVDFSGSKAHVPSQLQAFFEVPRQNGDCAIYGVVRCLKRMKKHPVLQWSESELGRDYYLIPAESIGSVCNVIENPNMPNSWFVLPQLTDFPNYLRLRIATEEDSEDSDSSQEEERYGDEELIVSDTGSSDDECLDEDNMSDFSNESTDEELPS